MDVAERVRARSSLLKALSEERSRAGDEGKYLFEAPRLERFLEGNGDSVDEAAAHFRRMLEWRRQFGMEKRRLQVVGKPWTVTSAPRLGELLDLLCVDCWSRTPEGHMIWTQHDGRACLDKLVEMPFDDVLGVLALMCELRQSHLDTQSHEAGSLRKIVQIRDMAGFSVVKLMRDAVLMRRLGEVLSIVNTAYPECLLKVVLINLPAGFNLLWSALQPMFNARIRSKVKFASKTRFTQDIVTLAGAQGLEALTRSRQMRWPSGAGTSAPLEIPAADVEYTCCRVLRGQRTEWRFEVQPQGEALQVRLVFAPEGRAATVEHIVDDEAKAGAVSGTYTAEQDGLLWLSLSNPSWSRSRRVVGLHLAPASPQETPSLCVCATKRTKRTSSRRRSVPDVRSCGCFGWLPWVTSPRSPTAGVSRTGEEGRLREEGTAGSPGTDAAAELEPIKFQSCAVLEAKRATVAGEGYLRQAFFMSLVFAALALGLAVLAPSMDSLA